MQQQTDTSALINAIVMLSSRTSSGGHSTEYKKWAQLNGPLKKQPEAVELFAMHAQKVLWIQILTFSQQSGMYCVTLVVWSSFQSHPAAVMLQSAAEEVYLLKTKKDFVLSTLFKLL